MTRVGFITSPLTSTHSVRGVGFYTQRLLASLKPLAPHYGFEILEISHFLDQLEQLGQLDIVHYPFFDLFSHTLPITKSCKTVVTIHDVIPLEFPAHYPPGLKGRFRLQLQKLALKSVDRVITDSYTSIKIIHKYLGVPHPKLKLVYLAADPDFKKISRPQNKYKLPPKFALYVGDINYNKNIPNLVLACRKANLPLVIVGQQATQLENLDLSHPELAHLEGIDLEGIFRLGFVPNKDLVHIYNLATVYCQPSLAEGFGLPVLEALACGTPVACSDIPVLHEIAADTAIYFDPYNIDDMAVAIKSAKNKNGPAQAAKFSWDKTARETLIVYQEIA